MKRLFVLSGALLLLAVASQHRAVAQQHRRPGDGADSRRVFPPHSRVDPRRRPGGRDHYRSHGHPHYVPRYIYISPPRGVWPYAYGYAPYYYEYPYLGPVYVPAEALYGPRALASFLGWGTFNGGGPAVNRIVPRADAQVPQQAAEGRAADPAENDRPLPRTNQEAIALAWKFIGYGDAHFAEGKYLDASQRYRKSVEAAPQLAAGHFRQGYALIAVGRYELAAKALKRGLALDPGWATSGFSNHELYGPDRRARTTHLDAMTEAADGQPHDADLMFLLGVFLHFDGQPERAADFFRRAGQLVGGDDSHVRAFVPG